MSTLQSAPRDSSTGRTGSIARPGPVLLLAAAGPLVIGYVAIAALLAVVTAAAADATLSTAGVLRAAGPAWLAAYHVPVRIAGRELGMLPLLPTVLMLAMVARSAANAVAKLDWYTPRHAGRVIAVVAGVQALFALIVASISGGASPIVAFAAVGVLAAVAAAVGTARRCGLVSAALARADDATRTGLRAGVLASVCLGAVGAVVLAAGLLASWPTTVDLFRIAAPGLGSGLGMLLLSVAYVPNVLVGAVSFTAGPGFGIGHVVVAQWRFAPGPLPSLPILAPVPAVEAHWWVFLMLLPPAAGVLAGLVCRGLPGPGARLRAVGVAALATGIGWLVLAALSGGALAGGPFDPVVVPAGSLAVAAALFVAVPGAVTVLLTGRETYVADIEEPDEPTFEDPVDEPEVAADSESGDETA